LVHQHKAAGMRIRLSKNNDHDGVSHGVTYHTHSYYYYYYYYYYYFVFRPSVSM